MILYRIYSLDFRRFKREKETSNKDETRKHMCLEGFLEDQLFIYLFLFFLSLMYTYGQSNLSKNLFINYSMSNEELNVVYLEKSCHCSGQIEMNRTKIWTEKYFSSSFAVHILSSNENNNLFVVRIEFHTELIHKHTYTMCVLNYIHIQVLFRWKDRCRNDQSILYRKQKQYTYKN